MFALTFNNSESACTAFKTAAYMRISTKGSGANMIVTIDEVID